MKPESKAHPPQVNVPRDSKLDRGTGRDPPAPDGERMRDEDYTDRDKPLLPGSREARRLQDRPPAGKEQLRVGTGGDAARPGKEGIEGKPVPPRGQL
jgi:hypothetical protein